jgi:hypothetical protein
MVPRERPVRIVSSSIAKLERLLSRGHAIIVCTDLYCHTDCLGNSISVDLVNTCSDMDPKSRQQNRVSVGGRHHCEQRNRRHEKDDRNKAAVLARMPQRAKLMRYLLDPCGHAFIICVCVCVCICFVSTTKETSPPKNVDDLDFFLCCRDSRAEVSGWWTTGQCDFVLRGS